MDPRPDLLHLDLVPRLRDALVAAGYDHAGVLGLLGPTAQAALARGETTPGLRAASVDSSLATLTRLWLLRTPVALEAARRALPGLVESMTAVGMLERSAGELRARVELRPFADGGGVTWLVSDPVPGVDGARTRVDADHVLGASGASRTLASLTVRDPAARALDLGTGCGVQSLLLAAHVAHVVATDVNARALAITRLNASLNAVAVETRPGSLYAPVVGERFDLVVTNPPFVVSPGTGERLAYRDSGLPGDEMVRRVVSEAPSHLSPGGTAQVLANWVHRRGEQWQDRLAGWVDASGCDLWAVQREVADPAEYVELWLKDAGLHGVPGYTGHYDSWLSWLDEQQVVGIGLGWLNLRRVEGGVRQPVLALEEWPYDVEQPVGGEVSARFRREDELARLADAALLACRLVVRGDVVQETAGRPGEADPETIVLRQQRGMRRAHRADTVVAGLVGACDGELSLAQILDALGSLLQRDGQELRHAYLDEVRLLLGEGFLDTR